MLIYNDRPVWRTHKVVIFLILAFALGVLVGSLLSSQCLCSSNKEFQSAASLKKQDREKSRTPIFVSPTTIHPKSTKAGFQDQESGFGEKIPLYLDYPTPATPS